mmetsp:Transcript_53184/g.154830  ORF Transcript_53184/g.154830 Transcript_53184/m.154830 type:complete len:275 (-) Transcript_53184:63-887(-)
MPMPFRVVRTGPRGQHPGGPEEELGAVYLDSEVHDGNARVRRRQPGCVVNMQGHWRLRPLLGSRRCSHDLDYRSPRRRRAQALPGHLRWRARLRSGQRDLLGPLGKSRRGGDDAGRSRGQRGERTGHARCGGLAMAGAPDVLEVRAVLAVGAGDSNGTSLPYGDVAPEAAIAAFRWPPKCDVRPHAILCESGVFNSIRLNYCRLRSQGVRRMRSLCCHMGGASTGAALSSDLDCWERLSGGIVTLARLNLAHAARDVASVAAESAMSDEKLQTG